MQKRANFTCRREEKKLWTINFDNYRIRCFSFFLPTFIVHYLICSLNFKFLTFYFCKFILLILFACSLPCQFQWMEENFRTILFSFFAPFHPFDIHGLVEVKYGFKLVSYKGQLHFLFLLSFSQ